MIVDHFKFSNQFLQRIIILFFVIRSLISYLLVNLAKQRMEFYIEMFKPLKYLNSLLSIESFELLSCNIVQNGVGLIDGSLGRKKYKSLIFFCYFLLIECSIEKEQSNLYLFKIEIILFGEIQGRGHLIYMFLLYKSKSQQIHY